MSDTHTLRGGHDSLSMVTCLSSDYHGCDRARNALTHYMGCLPYSLRDDYLTSLAPDMADRIQTELRRIRFLRRVLARSDCDMHLIRQLASSVDNWRRRGHGGQRANKEKDYAPPAPSFSHEEEEDGEDGWRYDVDKDMNAYLIEFNDSIGCDNTDKHPDGSPVFRGSFPNQKIPVYELLDPRAPNPLMRSMADRELGSSCVRYFHFPANNMKWIEDAIHRYYGETNLQTAYGQRSTGESTYASTLLRRDFWFGQEHGRGSPVTHSRHMRPLCELVSSEPAKVDPKPRNMVMFMPYLHWDLDHQRQYFSRMIETKSALHQKEMREAEERRYNERRQRRRSSKPRGQAWAPAAGEAMARFHTASTEANPSSTPVDNPPPREAAEAFEAQLSKQPSGRFRHIMAPYPKKDGRGRLLVRKRLGQLLYDAFKVFIAMGNYRDRQLIEKYLIGDAHLQPRRTLDQAHYWTLRNTRARDRDQVVYRGTSAKRETLHRFDPDEADGGGWSCTEEDRRLMLYASEMTTAEKSQQWWSALSDGTRRRLGSWLDHDDPGLPTMTTTATTTTRGPMVEPEARGYVSWPQQQQKQDRKNKTKMRCDEGSPGHKECGGCREAIVKVPRLVMVDQLWMWILDESTIITCFPKRYGVNRQDPSGVHKAIRQRLGSMKDNYMHSAYDIGLVIIEECAGLFFDRTKTDERQPQVVDIFSQAIGNMSQKHTISFDHFSHWADELARAASRKSALVDLSALHIALLNITPEVKLHRETKDVIEELGIMMHIVRKQKELLRRFIRNAESLLNPLDRFPLRSDEAKGMLEGEDEGEDEVAKQQHYRWRWFCSNASAVLQASDSHLDELEGLQKSAEEVCKSLEQLLALKQQQASVVQAWQAIRHGEEAVSQGRAIMIFTVITIVFLPLAFMAAIFGMNNQSLKDDSMSLRLQLKLIFTISLAVIVLVVGIAFGGAFRALICSTLNYYMTYFAVHLGLYNLWLKIPERLRVTNVVRRSERAVEQMKDQVKRRRRRLRARRWKEIEAKDEAGSRALTTAIDA